MAPGSTPKVFATLPSSGMDCENGPEFGEPIYATGCPVVMTVDPTGNLYIADYLGNSVDKISPKGRVTRVVDKVSALFRQPEPETHRFRPVAIAAGPGGRISIAVDGVGAVVSITR